MRLEPIILELEREQNDLLIIAHESVLRVLYGYLMACNAADIPFLEFPRDEIIEVRTQLMPLKLQSSRLTRSFRLSRKATKMRRAEYTSLICQKRLYLALRKILRFLYLPVGYPLPWLEE